MFSVYLLCDPWDLEQEGVRETLDRLQGEVGIDGITVVAAGGPVVQLRRIVSSGPLVFRSEGGLYFQPRESEYGSTRCKPLTADWIKTRDPVARIVETCRERKLSVRLAFATNRIGRMAERHPFAAFCSAFGDRSPGCLCPINPDVTAFLRAMISDVLAQHEPESIELHGVCALFDHDLLDGDSLSMNSDPSFNRGLGVCFCESCQQAATRAGIDASLAKNALGTWLNRRRAGGYGSDVSIDDLFSRNENLDRYVRHRCNEQRSFVSTLTEQFSGRIGLYVNDVGEFRATFGSMKLGGLRNLRAGHDAITQRDCSAVALELNQVGGNGPHTEATVMLTAGVDGPGLVRVVRELAECGFTGVTVDRYALMGEDHFSVVKQAIRFVHRE